MDEQAREEERRNPLELLLEQEQVFVPVPVEFDLSQETSQTFGPWPSLSAALDAQDFQVEEGSAVAED